MNLDKYRSDIERLITEGNQLRLSLELGIRPKEFKVELEKAVGGKAKAKQLLALLPSFNETYQAWYSEALALIRQLMNDRLADFIRLYERPSTRRKELSWENYVIEDALQGLRRTNPYTKEVIVDKSASIPRIEQQISIVKSVKRRFESSLFDIKQLLQADLFDSELEAAKELEKKGFARAAGAIAGVVLEGHLLQVCTNHKLTIKKKSPSISDLSAALKEHDVIDMPEWRRIQHLADLRNLCDHKRKQEPTSNDIDDLISGVDRVIKNLF